MSKILQIGITKNNQLFFLKKVCRLLKKINLKKKKKKTDAIGLTRELRIVGFETSWIFPKHARTMIHMDPYQLRIK